MTMTTTTIQSLIDFNGKKFDVCLMNPPYDKNLHLKFLEKVIGVAEKTVSVQPISFLQSPSGYDKKTSSAKKYENSVSKHIADLDILKDASTLFGIRAQTDIAIFVCNKDGGFDYKSLMFSQIDENDYKMFKNSANKFPKLVEFDETINEDKPFVNIKTFANNKRTTRYNIVAPNTYKIIFKGKLPNGEDWNDKKYKSDSFSKEKPVGIYFDTYIEAKNFYNSCLTEAYKYIVSVFKQSQSIPLNELPFMSDYKKPWDNERFFKYYNIDKDKQEEIITKMQPFMNESDKL